MRTAPSGHERSSRGLAVPDARRAASSRRRGRARRRRRATSSSPPRGSRSAPRPPRSARGSAAPTSPPRRRGTRSRFSALRIALVATASTSIGSEPGRAREVREQLERRERAAHRLDLQRPVDLLALADADGLVDLVGALPPAVSPDVKTTSRNEFDPRSITASAGRSRWAGYDGRATGEVDAGSDRRIIQRLGHPSYVGGSGRPGK